VYYPNAKAAIAVCDLTVEDFEPNLDAWIVNVKGSERDPLIVIVGNKSDLIAHTAHIEVRMRAVAQ
jgi:GTPase SAR1 family protein